MEAEIKFLKENWAIFLWFFNMGSCITLILLSVLL